MIEAFLIVEDKAPHRVTRSITSTEVPCSIPIVLDYLAEGNANVIYRIITFTAASQIKLPLELANKVVLRLGKKKDFIQPAKTRANEFQRFHRFIRPDHLVDLSLVNMDRDILILVNDDLNRLDKGGYRSDLRDGDLVTTDDPHGLLMADMTASGTETLLELKPKWLAQSPNAPPDAVRCRTCALRAQRQRAKQSGLVMPNAKTYCPLSIVSDDVEERKHAAVAILEENQCDWIPNGADRLAELFYTSPLLTSLRDNQVKLDTKGILHAEEDNFEWPDFCTAMTLRDCTLFVKTRNNDFDSATEMRLTDLDLKDATTDKVARWTKTETQLINEGWYTNHEVDAEAETICLLSRQPAK